MRLIVIFAFVHLVSSNESAASDSLGTCSEEASGTCRALQVTADITYPSESQLLVDDEASIEYSSSGCEGPPSPSKYATIFTRPDCSYYLFINGHRAMDSAHAHLRVSIPGLPPPLPPDNVLRHNGRLPFHIHTGCQPPRVVQELLRQNFRRQGPTRQV
jgi:hypothetical protein